MTIPSKSKAPSNDTDTYNKTTRANTKKKQSSYTHTNDRETTKLSHMNTREMTKPLHINTREMTRPPHRTPKNNKTTLYEC
ncbi:hypothetical protein C2G38_2212533 [Gigaspora rosea]|uniref:Uncharacterized protein n=1 Tax=Gigaspora rosea TaxID=44941 RepID=A0A397UL43_9GLOM|nr:hypothetical protein C2G38_2212533 [Gigaspora rosea]